jgi:phage head maturation protease
MLIPIRAPPLLCYLEIVKMSSVKFLSETETSVKVGGYGVVFGGNDLQGETFTPETDYALDLVPVKPVYYDHTLNDAVKNTRLGSVDKITVDDIGLWIEAELEKANEYTQAVMKLVAQGVVGWSSGTVSHLARREGSVIKSWPIVEFSLTATPAEPRTIGAKQLKALYPELADLLPEEKEEKEMSDNTPQAPAVDLTPVLNAIGDLGNQVKAFDARLGDLESKPTNDPGAVKSAPAVISDTEHWRYDNFSADDLALGIGILETGKQNGQSKRGANIAAIKALAMRMDSDEIRGNEPAQRAATAFKSLGIKANEIGQSTLANFGDEWVGVFYSGTLWQSIRQETQIVARIPSMEVPQGAESVIIQLESTDPEWYKVAQAKDLTANPGGIPTNTVTASKLGTARRQLDLNKMGARVLWTGELEEDSVLPYVAQLRRQLAVSAAEYMESAVIDGDTETGATTNINTIAGTPSGSEYYLLTDGFRKLALVTNTANSRDAGTLTSSDFLETIKLMGVGGSNADLARTAFIMPWAVHWKALELADVKTRDVFSGATIENGRLTSIYGYPIYVSHHMHKPQVSRLTNTAGKIDLNTAGNNTKSALLAVRFDQWMMGWRRRMTLETTRIPAADVTEIVALMRWGMINRDNEATAISYNITV